MARLKKIRTENEAAPKAKISRRLERGYIRVLMGLPLDGECNKFSGHGLTPDRRRMLWAQYRDAVRELVPGWVYEALDENYTHGPALHFTQAFDLDTRRRMRDAVTSN